MKRIAILQSNYIPWKGVFDLINSVDEFILYEDVKYTKRDWRNRNKIKTKDGLRWLTIPIKNTHGYQAIKDTLVFNHTWCEEHWRTLHHSYARAPYFNLYADEIKALYENCAREDHLSNINYNFYKLINKFLDIITPITWSMDYHPTTTGKNQRGIELCHKAGATHYLSGPAAKDYIEIELWQKNNLTLEYFSYDGYPEYPQLYSPFEHNVSILDLLFHTGPKARQYLLSFARNE